MPAPSQGADNENCSGIHQSRERKAYGPRDKQEKGKRSVGIKAEVEAIESLSGFGLHFVFNTQRMSKAIGRTSRVKTAAIVAHVLQRRVDTCVVKLLVAPWIRSDELIETIHRRLYDVNFRVYQTDSKSVKYR